jgi:hypothetical protein
MIGLRFEAADPVLRERRAGFFLAEGFLVPFSDFFTLFPSRRIVLAEW